MLMNILMYGVPGAIVGWVGCYYMIRLQPLAFKSIIDAGNAAAKKVEDAVKNSRG
jgi:hypothetical protein